MIALARGLRSAGHQPVFSITKDFGPTVEREGFALRELDIDVQAVALAMGDKVHNPLHFLAKVRELVATAADAAQNAADGMDIVVGAGAQVLASSICEARGLPYVYTAYAPTMLPSRLHPPISIPWQGLPGWLNSFFWCCHSLVVNGMLRGTVNRLRARHGLPPVEDVWQSMVYTRPLLGAFDPELGGLPPDFQGLLRTTGFWFLEDETPLDAALDAFVTDGSPPVYIGFGSMPHSRPEVVTRIVLDAVRQARVRAVIASGWAKLGEGGDLPANCFLVSSANHAQLFPRMSAVIHHGGAGTTANAARAGAPQLVIPHMFDQFYWGHRIHAQGLGPAPIPVKRLDARSLANAIVAARSCLDYQERAKQVADGLRKGLGVSRAVAEIEEAAARGKSGVPTHGTRGVSS